MSLKGKSGIRAGLLAAVVGLVVFCINCGVEFRPVANPVLQPGGDPQTTAHALVVGSNGSSADGTALIIDVTGDTAVALFSDQSCIHCGVGRGPVQATNLSGTDFVINRDDNSVSTFILPVTPGGALNPPNIVTLPQPSPQFPGVTPAVPVFGAVAQSTLYVAETGRNSLAIVTAANFAGQEIPVGIDPVALVATPDGTQLYSLNQGDNTVSVIFPAINQNVGSIALPAGATPVWGAVSADGTSVFILNQGTSTVSQINTLTDTLVPSTTGCTQDTFCVGPAPNYITYEATRNRAYVTSPSGNSLAIIDNNLGTVQTVSTAGPPCNGQHPIWVTALSDGTRVYVADDVTNSVCILNTTNNTFTKRICLVQDPGNGTACIGSATPISIASNSRATRVYTANQYTTGPFTISSICRGTTAPCSSPASGVVTVTGSFCNGSACIEAGHPVTIAGVNDGSYIGTFGVTSVNAAHTQLTYVQSGLPDSSPSGGTPTATVLPFVSLIQTSGDALVLNVAEATTIPGFMTPPLTISTGGQTPTFLTMTP